MLLINWTTTKYMNKKKRWIKSKRLEKDQHITDDFLSEPYSFVNCPQLAIVKNKHRSLSLIFKLVHFPFVHSRCSGTALK